MSPDTLILIALACCLIGLAFTIKWIFEGLHRIFEYFRDKHHADLDVEDWFKMLENRRKK